MALSVAFYAQAANPSIGNNTVATSNLDEAAPGSALDPNLLGEWGQKFNNGETGLTLNISVTPEAFEKLRHAWGLPASWHPQSNDAVGFGRNGLSYIHCLNCADGSQLVLIYVSRIQGNTRGPMLGTVYRFQAAQNKPEIRQDIPGTSEIPAPFYHIEPSVPGSLVDPAIIGTWVWPSGNVMLMPAMNSPAQIVEISTEPEAYAKARDDNHLNNTWTAKPNEAVGLDALGEHPIWFQYYKLEDGEHVIVVWRRWVEAYRYEVKADGIHLFELGSVNAGEKIALRAGTNASLAAAQSIKDQKIRDHLRSLATAAQQYMLDRRTQSVDSSDLIGTQTDRYIDPASIAPVEGEKYDTLNFNSATTQISVDTAEGREIIYNY
jgi:hypothetical protein